jgi:hypothetical protein
VGKDAVESDRPQATMQHSSCAVHTGYLRLQTQTQNMQYLLICHCKNYCTNGSQCYVIRTLPFLFLFICVWFIQQRRNHVTPNGWTRVNWKVCGKDWSSLTSGDIPALVERNAENQKILRQGSRSKGHNLNRWPPEHEAALLGTRTRRSLTVNRRKYSTDEGLE